MKLKLQVKWHVVFYVYEWILYGIHIHYLTVCHVSMYPLKCQTRREVEFYFFLRIAVFICIANLIKMNTKYGFSFVYNF